MKEVKIFEVTPSTPIPELEKKVCKRFCKWEDWRYGLFFVQTNSWLIDGEVSNYPLKPLVI